MKDTITRIKALLLIPLVTCGTLSVHAEEAVRHTLTVVAQPAMAGTFNTATASLAAGETIQLYAYANSNFTFKEWTDTEKRTLSVQPEMTYTMLDKDVTLTAVYEYNPLNPQNPARNDWNALLGNVIVDDFTTGSLAGAITAAINGSKPAEVLMITVSGRINTNDLGIINTYTNCTLLDLSRVSGLTEVPSYAFDYTKLESAYLPATVEKIGYRAFYECKQLTSLTVYAMVPPTLDGSAFGGVQEGLVVYVPAAALTQYQEADGWKNFTLLPIQEDIRSLTVMLPTNAKVADYAQMWLELTNTKSGQKMHYVMTDRTAYTFANIIRNTSWNVVVRNERGDMFGQIDGVEVKDEDVTVTFTSLTKPQRVTLSVLTPDGKDVTGQVQVTWTDGKGNYMAQGTSLSGLPTGYSVNYSMTLSKDLAMTYSTPTATEYTLKDGSNALTIQLQAIKQVQLTGRVKDASTGQPLGGAVVSASQTFGGKYGKTPSVKSDASGVFTMTVASVPTTVTYAAKDYISQTQNLTGEEFNGQNELSVSDVLLKAITGVTITTSFTYTSCDGEEQSWYSDYQNVSYELFDVTKNRPISQYNVQYPQIVLLEEIADGDVLRLTATSRTNAFMPVNSTVTIVEQKATAMFDIVELGKIQSIFTTTGNATVVGSLYDAKGKLLKSYDYSNASLTISDLTDGQYTLITMGSSPLFNTIYDLAQLPNTGLVKGTDYVQHSVEVKSGTVSSIHISEVPTLNENKLYYTSDNTSFTVNKASIVSGNYLTLTGKIDFKSAYSTGVSNVNLIVDIPESSSFVEGSVMVGNTTGNYTLNGNRLTIPLARFTDRVRFCIIPTRGGDYAPSALVQFDLNGKTVMQPIGSANYTVKDLSISVPSTVAKTTIPVSGTANGISTIEVYDGDILIGQTNSLANGTWATTCELNEPYNLSTHNIYAKVITKSGVELQSENVVCTYDMNAIQVSKVKMFHDNPEMHKTYEIVFDFLNPIIDSQYYIYYIYNKKFTFTIDFTSNDTTKISNVVLNVKTGNGTVTSLDATYNETQQKWVALGEFGNMYDGNIPVNVSVDYYYEANQKVDRRQIDDDCSAIADAVKANMEERALADEEFSLIQDSYYVFAPIDSLLEADSLDIEALSAALDSILCSLPQSEVSISDEDFESLKTEFDLKYQEWEKHYNSIEKDSLLNCFFDNDTVNYDFDKTFEILGGTVNYSVVPISIEEISHLSEGGYDHFPLTDSSLVYYKFSEDAMEFIDASLLKKFVVSSTNEMIETRAKANFYRSDLSNVETCAKSISTTAITINELWRNGELTTLQASKQLHSLYGFVECYYSSILSNANYTLVKGINEKIHAYDEQIMAGEELRDLHLHRIEHYKGKIEEAGKMKEIVDARLAKNQELLSGYLSDQEIKELAAECEKLSNESEIYRVDIELNKSALISSKDNYKKYDLHVKNLKKGRAFEVSAKSKINSILAKLPSKLIPGQKAAKVLAIGGKVAGFFGEVLQVWSLGVDVLEAANELEEWAQLEDAIDRKMPCENDYENAMFLHNSIHSDAARVLAHYITIISSEVGAMSFDLAGGFPAVAPTWWCGKFCDIYAEWAKFLFIEKYIKQRGDYWYDMMCLQCTGNEPKDQRLEKGNMNLRHEDSKTIDSGKGIDPSGYVYECVFSNRLEGVTATCYYREELEDMYGDLHENIVKWDAEEYAQENPLFTDDNGFYRWDVPQGLWQVKFEKEGYETTYSEWLPVPPPQLDVNIAMKQNVQPNVKNARAYEDAVEVEFDKYMLPELLSTENIVVMNEGKPVAGTVELLNEEVAYEGATETYASKVRFTASDPFEGQEVTLLVHNRVKSYAGIRMQDDFSQTFTIEQEIRQIVCDSAIVVGYGKTGLLTVSVLPASAAAGKPLTVRSSSSLILRSSVENIVLDDQGKAELTVYGELPGAAALSFTIDGYDLMAMTIVNVENTAYKTVASPTANVASGSTVIKGTEVTLSCKTEGATIYYTLDGSCPCDEATRLTYTAPIVINETVTIKAMAVASDMYESDVAEFDYTVLSSIVIPFTMTEVGWGTLIVPFYAEVPSGLTAYTCSRYSTAGEVNWLDLERTESLAANTPYILSGAAGEYSFTGVPDAELMSYTNGLLTGVYVATSIDRGYVLQKQDDEVAFFKVANGKQKTVPAYRCYLNDQPSNSAAFYFGDTTLMENVLNEVELGDGIVYDLQGRRCEGTLKSGVYIRNKQLFYVK